MVKKGKNKNDKRPRSRRSGRMGLPVGGGRLGNHIRMLVDPCNSPLGPNAYRGQDGITQRFGLYDNVTSATDTAYVFAYYPAYNRIYRITALTGTTSFTPNYATAGPGQTFLYANSMCQRPVAACVSLQYTGTELNRSGQISYGMVKSSVFAAATTANALTSILPVTHRVPDGPVEVRWEPSPTEEEYVGTGTVTPEAGPDRNIMLIVITGLSAGVDVSLKLTSIIEWQPLLNVGLVVPTANTPDVPAGLERVRTTLAGMGNWWASNGGTVVAGAKMARELFRAPNPQGPSRRFALEL